MSVYVDSAIHRYGRMLMCHMVADTRLELLQMAATIGVNRKWLQHEGRPDEHFDVCKSYRADAIAHGALEVTSREIVAVIRKKRATGSVDHG